MKIDDIQRNLQWLRGEDGVAAPANAKAVLGDVLEPLLKAEGLQLFSPKTQSDAAIDFVARPADASDNSFTVAIEYKHYGNGQAIGSDTVRKFLGTITSGPFTRALLISRFGFTTAATLIARDATKAYPTALQIELHDLATLESWIGRVIGEHSQLAAHIQFLVRSVSHDFAKLVAENGAALEFIERRELEKMMERVMAGLGFQTTLTPGSKDGGKDLILQCAVKNKNESYIVELKHWRAGKQVVKGTVSDFVRVLIRENRDGGLFLSTSGYASNAGEALSEITSQRLNLGGKTKIIKLCQTYIRASSGLWQPPEDLPELLFEGSQ